MRWKIETFHKILESSCKTEESRLRTADRRGNLIAFFCVLGRRIFCAHNARTRGAACSRRAGVYTRRN